MRKTSPSPPIRVNTMQNTLNSIKEKMLSVYLNSGTKLTRIAIVAIATQIIVVEATNCNLAIFLRGPSLKKVLKSSYVTKSYFSQESIYLVQRRSCRSLLECVFYQETRITTLLKQCLLLVLERVELIKK